MTFLCPLCEHPLVLNHNAYSCVNRHQFDVAKEGYVNLMPVQHKRSKDPGDNQEMTQARRRFLQTGHYAPMREKVAQLCQKYLTGHQQTLLDIGCGEGYYTDFFANAVRQQDDLAQTVGLDISKVAIRYAAKRYPDCQFTVASSHRLPFADQSLAAVIRIYAPCKESELQRCVQQGGVVITVTPAARHLYQFKQGIYDQVRLHPEQTETLDGFELVEECQLHYPMTLNGSEAADLLQMTPFAWRASETFKQQVGNSETFMCEADFMLRVYLRK
ncbi:23S rRNA (guanine(745)-N(1))-methyltransferase [Vibrio misgurnus]|uniref:23S rRNA (guanine(745)-N(1))-methyltransferase n=1 Tax=Vibrio misgurnus TaxID=2993714 RepID=UPI0023F8D412|nr:23S rRNA (guanine(745)-N(1))-methyltransferase [Vibrio sp. VCS]